MTPRRLFRSLAIAEACTWAALLAGMTQKYVLDAGEWGVRLAGPVHGFVFLAFVVGALLVAVNQRWSWRVTLVTLASAVPPLATVPMEVWLERGGRLEGEWRRTPEERRSRAETVLQWVLARPAAAVVIAAVGVAVVFTALLTVGPPTGGES